MYVVIEYNQASGWPSLWTDNLYDDKSEAENAMQEAVAETRAVGRMERYRIGQVIIDDDD